MYVAENKELVLDDNEQIMLTRQCNKIIYTLYSSKLSNKELAKTIGVSASALSNSLQKIKNTGLDLLTIEQNGRNTYYSLSDIGRRYAEEKLLNGKIINIEDRFNFSIQKEKLLLEDIKETWGEEWKLKFDELLLQYTAGEKSQGEECFQRFINAVESILIEENWEKLNSLYSLLGDEILKKRIEKYFQELIGIKYLCKLDNYDWKMAYKLIDDLFDNLGEFIRREFLEKFESNQFTSEQINLIIYSINKMKDEALKKKMKKDEFYNEWESVFKSHEKLMYYIAEKYNTHQ